MRAGSDGAGLIFRPQNKFLGETWDALSPVTA